MAHKFKVGEIVLHKDGQYECRVLKQLHPITHNNPSYELRDGSTIFNEVESYLIGQDDE